MKTISIIGATFTGNHGSEAMLMTTIMRIKEAVGDVEFNVFSYYPRDDRKAVQAKWIRIFSSTPVNLVGVIFPSSLLFFFLRKLFPSFIKHILPQPVVALAGSDICIDLAGVSFIDGRTKFLPFNVFTILPMLLLDIPLVKFSQAMGPFDNVINRKCANIFLNRCRKVFARGEITYQNIVVLSSNIPVSLAADITFLHKSGDSLIQTEVDSLNRVLKEAESFRASSKKVIGICPSSLIAETVGNDYAHTLSFVAKKLIGNGFGVIVFPGSSRMNAKGKNRNNDLPVVSLIDQALRDDEYCRDSFVCCNFDTNADSIKLIISSCDIMVASRFHTMTSCLSLGVPVFVICWGHKYIEVLNQFKQSRWACDWAKIDQHMLYEKLLLLFEHRDEEKQVIASMMPMVKESSMVQLKYVLDYIEGRDA
jgi:colanic acid/amylovoran biosynthesis protein